MRKPVTEVQIGTLVRWVCSCGQSANEKPFVLTHMDAYVGSLDPVCEVEVVEEEAAAGPR